MPRAIMPSVGTAFIEIMSDTRAGERLFPRAMLSSFEATDELLLLQEAAEDERLLKDAPVARRAKEQYSCKEDNETTAWLKHTGWPIILANRPLDILTASTLPPAAKSNDDYYLGHWAGLALIRYGANEAKLRHVLQAVDQMFDRADSTLACTTYRLRCWLQTYHQRHFRPMAFKQLGTKSSRIGYISIWKQFICYVFRVWATPKSLRNDIYGLVFQPAEAQRVEYIWSTLLEEIINTQSEASLTQDSDQIIESEEDADSVNETEYDSEAGSDLDSEEDSEQRSEGGGGKLDNDSCGDWDSTLRKESRK